MAQKQSLSPQQKAILFQQATRQNYQMLASKKVSGEVETIQFDLPKTRLLSKIVLEVEAVATLKSSSATIALAPFSPYEILRRISLDLNNGFAPYVVSGREAYLYNMMRLNPDVLKPSTTAARGMTYIENAATAAGKDAKIKFQVALPVTLNDRDTTGLVLLQNEQTNVVLKIDVDTLAKAYKLNTGNGDEVTFKSMTINAMMETFSIPPIEDAFPDITVIKLVDAKGESFAGNGQNIVPLRTGTIYRKLVFLFEDNDGNPLKDEDFSGNLELVFNGADIPYSIKPSVLSGINHSQLGYPMQDGIYVWDFTNQGIPNLGGSRDYIDTERLTEFWVRFSTQKAGKVTIVSEKLSRLLQG